jgi:hypothetical protein
MSKIKVDQIEGSSGSTITIPTGQSLVITDGLASASLPTVPTTKGGTGLTSIGTAGQVVKVNSGATALEFGDIDSFSNTTITSQTAETSVADDDLILISDTSAGALRKMTKANFTAGVGGLSVADQWRITADTSMSGGGDFFTTNWERVDNTAQGTVGSAMTESSGVFTFPSTGVYLVTFQGSLYAGTDGTGSVQLGVQIHATTNNSTYTEIADGYFWNVSNQFTYNWGQTSTMIDVTDTTQVKVKFKNYNGGSNNPDRQWRGNTSKNETFATFLKLGAT